MTDHKHNPYGRAGDDRLKLRPAKPLYIACDDLDLSWYPDEIDTVLQLWDSGMPIWDMAQRLKRRQEEICILVIDLAMRDKIEKRERGLLGRREDERY